MKRIEALVGHCDTGRLAKYGNEMKERGGLAGYVDDVVDEIKKRSPEAVDLSGEMLPYCVKCAVEKLLGWKKKGKKPIKEVRVDLRNCRGTGSSETESGGFTPNAEQLVSRRLAPTSRLSESAKNDPRLKIVPE